MSICVAGDSTTIVHGKMASAHKIIIQFQEDIAPKPDQSDALNLTSPLLINTFLQKLGAETLVPLFKDWQNFSEHHFAHNLHQFYLVTFGEAMNISAIIDELFKYETIITAEPDNKVYATVVPDDTYYLDQWAHDNFGQAGYQDVGALDCDMDTDLAWDITTGDPEVIIAILDTGINERHLEFTGKIVQGYDFVNDDDDATDDNGHGTGCAGIAAATGNNNQGIAGVSWGSHIMPIKVLDSSAGGDNTDVANGVIWATDHGARVVSMSLAGGGYMEFFNSAINAAVDNGTVVFAATGNDNSNVPAYPSNYENCLAVGAISPCNERKNPASCDGETGWGSNYGPHLDFLAPGVLITTTTLDGGYSAFFNGTSAACPNAAGIAALMLSVNPEIPVADVCSIMQNTSDDISGEGWNEEIGYGRLNAYSAVNAAYNFCGNSWTQGDVNNDGELNILDLVVLVNLILGIEADPEHCLQWAANFNCDDDINVLDIIQIISVIIAE